MKSRVIAFLFSFSVLLIGIFGLAYKANASIKILPPPQNPEVFIDEGAVSSPTKASDGFLVDTSMHVNNPATNSNGNGTIDSGEMGSWSLIAFPSDVRVTNFNAGVCNGNFTIDEHIFVQVDTTPSFDSQGGFVGIGGSPLVTKQLNPCITNTLQNMRVAITGLTANTLYYVRVEVLDAAKVQKYFTNAIQVTTKNDSSSIASVASSYNGSGTQLVSSSNTGSVVDPDEDTFSSAITCDLAPSTWAGCFARWTYFLVYKLSAVIVSASGWVFDVLINFSISSYFYAKSTFVTSGWGIVRDISNLVFIFALLWAGIKTILGDGGSGVMKTIGSIIVVALLVNFSLFVTRVVVDAGNILARVFYTQIAVTGHTSNDHANSALTGLQEVHISEGLTQGLSLQKVFTQETVDTLKRGGGLSAGTAFLIIVLGTVVNLVAAWTLFVCGFLMIGRIVGLWLVMIGSPFAFVSRVAPLLKNVEFFGWESWLKNLMSLTFLAPVFLFFMYLIILFINTKFLDGLLLAGGSADNTKLFSGDYARVLIGILLQFMVIIALISKARQMAEKMSGEIGSKMVSAAKWAGGLAIGVASGGTAMLARGTLGRVASTVAQSGSLRKTEAKGGWRGYLAGQTLRASGNVADSNLDFRSSRFGTKIASETGANVNVTGGPRKGGFTTIRKENKEAFEARAKVLEVTEDEKLKQAQNKAEAGLQEIFRSVPQGWTKSVSQEIESLDARIKSARESLTDARNGGVQSEIDKYKEQLAAYKEMKGKLKGGEAGSVTYTDNNGQPKTETFDYTVAKDKSGNTIGKFEKEIIPEAKRAVENENKQRKADYAKFIENKLTKVVNVIASGGQFSTKGANEAAHKIRMSAKETSGEKT